MLLLPPSAIPFPVLASSCLFPPPFLSKYSVVDAASPGLAAAFLAAVILGVLAAPQMPVTSSSISTPQKRCQEVFRCSFGKVLVKFNLPASAKVKRKMLLSPTHYANK